jgi:hypothetical protein
VHRFKQSYRQTQRIAKNPLILKREKLDIGNQATVNPQCQVISHTDIATILRTSWYALLHAMPLPCLKEQEST